MRLFFQSPHLLPNINFKVGNLANSQSTARKTNRIHTMHLFAHAVYYAFLCCFTKTCDTILLLQVILQYEKRGAAAKNSLERN